MRAGSRITESKLRSDVSFDEKAGVYIRRA